MSKQVISQAMKSCCCCAHMQMMCSVMMPKTRMQHCKGFQVTDNASTFGCTMICM